MAAQNRELLSENQSLKEGLRELTRLNNELRSKISELREDNFRQIVLKERQEPTISRSSRIRKNNHIRSVGR